MVFNIDGKEIAVSHVQGEWFAYLNRCTHMELPLDEGKIEGCIIECPHHGAQFDLRTGEVKSMPAAVPLEIYKVRLQGEDIQVEVC